MKRISLLALALICAYSSFAQNCKYKKNEVDKFTGKHVKQTKDKQVIGTFYTAGDFSVLKEGEDYFLVFDYVLTSYSNFKPHSIPEGSELVFLLVNGKTISAKSVATISGQSATLIGLPPLYTCKLKQVRYSITKDQLVELAKEEIKAIRFNKLTGEGNPDVVDNDIKRHNQDDIKALISCVL